MRYISLRVLCVCLITAASVIEAAGAGAGGSAAGETASVCCCGFYSGGLTGNTNCDPEGKVTLSDVSRLIDRVYISKTALCCEAAGNTTGDAEGLITLSDITRLIDNLYISKAAPADCPEKGMLCCYSPDPPYLEAVAFYHDPLTMDYYPHSSPAFSPDCGEVFWGAFLADGPEDALLYSVFTGTGFTPPESPPFSQEVWESGPAFSPGGDTLFFSSERPLPWEPETSTSAIWFVHRDGEHWSAPEILADVYDPLMTNYGSITVASNGNLYYSGRRQGDDGPNIYESELIGGVYTLPVTIEGEVNVTTPVKLDPYVDPEERFLLFCSFSTGALDLFVSYRQPDETWGEATRLPSEINTGHMERFPSITRDGEYFIFVRAIGDYFPSTDTKFYWVSSEVLGLQVP